MLLSDLHLGDGGPGEAFDRDAELTAFLEQLAADGKVTDVVLLGDVFDLVEGEIAGADGRSRADATARAVARLDEVTAAHPQVLAALTGLLRVGKNLTVVRGNHDVELVRPQVQEQLSRILGAGGGPAAGRLVFTPWLLHLPGILLAEHGHQHHDINRFDRQLWPFRTEPTTGPGPGPGAGPAAGPVQEPFGAELSRLHHTASGPRLSAKIAGSVLRHGLRLQGPRRRRRCAEYRRSMLPELVSGLGLSLATAQRLDAGSERSAVQILARIGRQIARQRTGERRPADGYLPTAAAAVLRTLGPAAPPYLVYGHSHAADAITLAPLGRGVDRSDGDSNGQPNGSPTTYLNTGTWCRRGPGAGDTTLTPAAATWVEISDGPGHPARVLCWTTGGPQLLAEVTDGKVVRS